jgi:Gpi18-like mannosyltransferase
MYTQQGRKVTNQDAMTVWEVIKKWYARHSLLLLLLQLGVLFLIWSIHNQYVLIVTTFLALVYFSFCDYSLN